MNLSCFYFFPPKIGIFEAGIGQMNLVATQTVFKFTLYEIILATIHQQFCKNRNDAVLRAKRGLGRMSSKETAPCWMKDTYIWAPVVPKLQLLPSLTTARLSIRCYFVAILFLCMFQQCVQQQLGLSKERFRYELDKLEIGVQVPVGIFSSFLRRQNCCVAHSLSDRVDIVCSCLGVKAARA